jgi:hypothetical protein
MKCTSIEKFERASATTQRACPQRAALERPAASVEFVQHFKDFFLLFSSVSECLVQLRRSTLHYTLMMSELRRVGDSCGKHHFYAFKVLATLFL